MMYIDQNNWESPEVVRRLKTSPPLVRHFNYSLKGNRSYKVETIMRDSTPKLIWKTRYIKNMMARAHATQIGHLRIYFSGDMPVGLFHPECGPLCVDNFWNKQTAYHLNQVNRKLDDRMSLEHFHTTLNHYLREETKKDIKLFIPILDDWEIGQKIMNDDYITRSVW